MRWMCRVEKIFICFMSEEKTMKFLLLSLCFCQNFFWDKNLKKFTFFFLFRSGIVTGFFFCMSIIECHHWKVNVFVQWIFFSFCFVCNIDFDWSVKVRLKKMKFRSKVLKSINKASGNMIWKKKLSLLFSLYKIFYRFVNNSMFHVLSIIIIIIIIILKKRQEERIE